MATSLLSFDLFVALEKMYHPIVAGYFVGAGASKNDRSHFSNVRVIRWLFNSSKAQTPLNEEIFLFRGQQLL